jgi:hypothetical protein
MPFDPLREIERDDNHFETISYSNSTLVIAEMLDLVCWGVVGNMRFIKCIDQLHKAEH